MITIFIVFYIILFWQLANNRTKTDDAKRFYTLFALFGVSSSDGLTQYSFIKVA
jgi:ATP/ADP translocase